MSALRGAVPLPCFTDQETEVQSTVTCSKSDGESAVEPSDKLLEPTAACKRAFLGLLSLSRFHQVLSVYKVDKQDVE